MPESIVMDKPRRPLVEKVVILYEQILNPGKDFREGPSFWDDFFLLWANIPQLEKIISSFPSHQLMSKKPLINSLFYQCTAVLSDNSSMRVVNGLRTLSGLIRSIVKSAGNGFGFDLIDLLIGFDHAEVVMQNLIERLNQFLCEDRPPTVRILTLQLLLVLATSSELISQNTVLEYMMVNSLFESLMHILASPATRSAHGYDAVLLLALLLNYRKYEAVNPYIVKLSILDDELALNGYCHVVGSTFTEYNRTSQSRLEQSQTTGLFSRLTNMVGGMLVPDERTLEAMKSDESMLLAMYEAVHLNRNFVSTLTSVPTDPSCSYGEAIDPLVSTPTEKDPNNVETMNAGDLKNLLTDTPSLLVAFLTYCSVVMQDLKHERNFQASKLSWIILTCIAEDQYANSLMHDQHMAFRVPLYRAPMRHRKVWGFDRCTQALPLACSVLDLSAEFILSHMMRQFPFELYLRCLGVVHRIICYQKKCRMRLQYPWRDLYNALATLLKFLVANEDLIFKQNDLFQLLLPAVNLFNLFITYGDTFLPNPNSYDELYYELIRNAEIFQSLTAMALRYAGKEGPHQSSAAKLCNHLVNVRAIIDHFQPKIESLTSAGLGSLTQEQVLEIVRTSYDSLTLKLQESLDVYERYNESKEPGFFIQTVRFITVECKRRLEHFQLDHQTVLKEISSFT